MPMRSEVMDDYYNAVIQGSEERNNVFEEIYRHTMDNRIFNNLK